MTLIIFLLLDNSGDTLIDNNVLSITETCREEQFLHGGAGLDKG